MLETPSGIIAGCDSRSSSSSAVANPLSDKLFLVTPRSLNLAEERPAEGSPPRPFFCLAVLRCGVTAVTQAACRDLEQAARKAALEATHLPSNPSSPSSPSSFSPGTPWPLLLAGSVERHASKDLQEGAHGALLAGYVCGRSPPDRDTPDRDTPDRPDHPSHPSHPSHPPSPSSGLFELLTRNLNTLDLSLSKTPSLHVDLSKYASPEFLHEGLAAAGSGGRDARGAAELGLGALRRGEFGGGELAERLRAAAAGGEDPMGEEEAAQVRLVAESVLHAMRTDSASGGVARVVVVRRSEARPAEGVLREFLFEQTTSASEIRILKGETSRLR